MAEQVDKTVIDKISKLLDHYKGSLKINSESEALVALDLAKKLMAKYHLDMMQFNDTISDESILHQSIDKFSVYTTPLWICNLINIVNNICNCSCILDKDPQPNGYIHTQVIFVALKEDLEYVLQIYKILKKTVQRLSNEHVKSINGNTTNWRSFAEGFTSRLLEKSRMLNSDDDFGDVEIDEDIDLDDIEKEEFENEEFSDTVFDDEEIQIDSTDIVQNKKMDIDKYLKNVKIKINEYIYKTFNAKQEKLKTKTRVLIDSYNCGKNKAESQKLPDINSLKQNN